MQLQNTTLVEPGVYKMDLGVGSDGVTPNIKYVDKTGANLLGYKPAMQTTSQQTRQDVTTSQKIDAISGATPTAPNANVQNNGQPTAPNANGQPQPQAGQNNPAPTNINYKNPDGTQTTISETAPTNGYSYQSDTPLVDGQKYGYDTNGKRYIVGKDGTVTNDAQADKEYEINKAEITAEKNKNDILDKIQASADTAHASLIDSIRRKSAYNKQLQKDTNARYLALKQNEGFSGGTARYMSDINNGVLQDTENKAIEALNAIDVAEEVAIAEATAAKTDKDFERAYKKMNEIDELQKNKRTAILDLMKATNDRNKALQDQEKAIKDAEKAKTDRGIKILDTGASAIAEAYDALKTQKEKDTAVENYAKKIGVTVEEVLGSIKEYKTKQTKADAELAQTKAQTNASNRSNQPKAKDTTVDEFGNEVDVLMTPEEQQKAQTSQDFFDKVDRKIAGGGKDEAGVPIVVNNYLSYAAFKELLKVGVEKYGIPREDIINRYQSRLNLSTLFNRAEEYGLTKAEYTKLKNANK